MTTDPQLLMLLFLVVAAFGVLAWYDRDRATRLRERALDALAGERPAAQSTVMKLGSRGLAVVRWKVRLRELGYVLLLDDLFDEETAAATAAYQESLGMVADGIAGPHTQRIATAGYARRLRQRWFGWRR